MARQNYEKKLMKIKKAAISATVFLKKFIIIDTSHVSDETSLPPHF